MEYQNNNDVYIVNRNIDSLEEIIDEVPEGCTHIKCINKGLKFLKGIERLPQVINLDVHSNEIQSLEFITESNVKYLNISLNRLQSLEFITGSKVTYLNVYSNEIQSLEFITGSNVKNLNICRNHVRSLEFVTGSKIIYLYVYNNPCEKEYIELGESIDRVKEKYYDTLEIKEPSED